MNTEHELFGELHEQEENGLFGNEHRRQYEAQQEALRLSAVSNSCLICGKKLDVQTAKYGNGTCSEYCNAKYSGYPMPSDYSEGLQKLVNNCC